MVSHCNCVCREQMRCRLKNLYDMQTALRWAAELAAALAALHEQQPPYIHGDVKADNAFLTDTDDLACAEAKLGDLKPHRHVYDREPSTLSQHQQHAAAAVQQKRQSSLELFSLERSSMGSSTSWTSSPAANGNNISNKNGPVPVGWISKQQQQQADRKLAAEQPKQQPIPLQRSSSDNTPAAEVLDSLSTSAAAGVAEPAQCPAARAASLPLPIVAKATALSEAATSCPSHWHSSTVLDASVGGDAYYWRSASRSSSLPEQLGGIGGPAMSRSLPITSCLSASEMADVTGGAPVVTAASAVDMKRPAAAGAAASQQKDSQCEQTATDSSGSSWRRNRTVTLSDSASSTNSGSGSSGAGKAVGLVSLADADMEEEAMDDDQQLLHKVAAVDQDPLSCKQEPATLQGAAAASEQLDDLQDSLDCTAHAGHRQRSKSDMSGHLQAPARSGLQLAALPLATSKSAPATVYRGCLQDEKVHCGSLKELGLLQGSADAAAAADDHAGIGTKSPQQQKVAAAAETKRQFAGKVEHALLAESGVGKVRRKQQMGQPVGTYGWELSPSGAASPCGAVHSVMLDLFADFAEDDVPISRWGCRQPGISSMLACFPVLTMSLQRSYPT
eukprot:GHUV01031299.1.p1 GENE.GHUV01031299.1~~GHUV01031299.1.p1  ORF type:complete len:617 (+),score=235.90 GHUV01031299.1:203-2053(+)